MRRNGSGDDHDRGWGDGYGETVPEMTPTVDTPTDEATEERHASNLELFVDLVFVFAITQVTSLIADELTWAGVGRGMLVAWLVWWLWSQYVWAGTVLDLERSGNRRRTAVLASIPPALLMAVAIPSAYGTTGMLFAVAYLIAQAWMIAIQGQASWSDALQRAAWLRFAPLAMISPVLVAIGANFGGPARTAWWIAAALLGVAGAINSTRRRTEHVSAWSINPSHFAERHSLFMIISLGEVLVAIGAKVTEKLDGGDLTAELVVTVVVCVFLAAVLWWVYFAIVPRACEAQLSRLHANDRARYARDAYTFTHFAIVLGVVFYAVVAKHVVVHPGEPLDRPDRWMLAASVLFFAGGLIVVKARTTGGIAFERVAVIAVGCGAALFGDSIDAIAAIAVIGVMMIGAQSITRRRFARSSLGRLP